MVDRKTLSSIIEPVAVGGILGPVQRRASHRLVQVTYMCPRPPLISSSLLAGPPRWCSASSGPCRVDQPLLTSPMRYRSGRRMSL